MKLSKPVNVFFLLLFIGIGMLFFLPFLWMILSSVKPEGLIRGRPELLWPRDFTLANYELLLVRIPFARFP
jgi:multiple sugar transport system permease protein